MDELQQTLPADQGDGMPIVTLGFADRVALSKLAARTKSDPSGDSATSANFLLGRERGGPKGDVAA